MGVVGTPGSQPRSTVGSQMTREVPQSPQITSLSLSICKIEMLVPQRHHRGHINLVTLTKTHQIRWCALQAGKGYTGKQLTMTKGKSKVFPEAREDAIAAQPPPEAQNKSIASESSWIVLQVWSSDNIKRRKPGRLALSCKLTSESWVSPSEAHRAGPTEMEDERGNKHKDE